MRHKSPSARYASSIMVSVTGPGAGVIGQMNRASTLKGSVSDKQKTTKTNDGGRLFVMGRSRMGDGHVMGE